MLRFDYRADAPGAPFDLTLAVYHDVIVCADRFQLLSRALKTAEDDLLGLGPASSQPDVYKRQDSVHLIARAVREVKLHVLRRDLLGVGGKRVVLLLSGTVSYTHLEERVHSAAASAYGDGKIVGGEVRVLAEEAFKHRLVLVGIERAGRIDERAAVAAARGGGGEYGILYFGQSCDVPDVLIFDVSCV